jgi:hypothetical protein
MRAVVRRCIAIGLFGAVSLVGAEPGHAAGTQIRVVAPGGSIQRAVDLSNPGDIVQLSAGTYAGGILITKDHLTIRGAGRDSVLVPATGSACAASIGDSGVCVTGTTGRAVTGVAIEDLSVRGFAGFGVVGFFTDQLRVARVVAIDNTEYGVTEFASTRGYFVDNWVTGATSEAGLYVGDIDDAGGTVVANNHATSNQIGLLVRHARHVVITGNTFDRNCAGVVLVDDGQLGGAGDTTVARNTVADNNADCPAHEEVPPLRGTGIAVIGGDHDVVEANVVTGNRGDLEYSGGIGLFPGIPPGGSVAGQPASYHRVASNLVANNSPANLIDQSGSATNVFLRNRFLVPIGPRRPSTRTDREPVVVGGGHRPPGGDRHDPGWRAGPGGAESSRSGRRPIDVSGQPDGHGADHSRTPDTGFGFGPGPGVDTESGSGSHQPADGGSPSGSTHGSGSTSTREAGSGSDSGRTSDVRTVGGGSPVEERRSTAVGGEGGLS